MADSKLSALTELAVEPADTDEVYVNDGGTSKRITYGTLKTALLARANHTGTQAASTISDFAAAVAATASVTANTAKISADDPALVSALAAVTADGGDYAVILDTSVSPNALKKILISDLLDNATHTGQVTGSGALTVQPAAISDQTLATAVGTDYVLMLDTSDSPNTLKKALISDFASSGGDLKADGTVPLTANWDVGSFDITAEQFHSDVVTGTAPFTVASTTVVANLNADLLDGNQATAFATAAQGSTADSALQDVVDDLTPTLGGNLAAGGFNVTDLGDVTFKTGAAGGTLRTGTSASDKFQLQAYDVNGAAYVTLIEADAGNDVRLQIPVNYLDLEDATDTTKIARFDVSGVATGTTRTITMPDANVDLGAIATNTAKVTNATHTGDATGATALTLQPAAIAGKGAVTVAGGDLLLVTDVSASPQVLGQVTAQSIADLAAPQGTAIRSDATSPATTDGYVLTADGAGGAAWEAAAAGSGDFKADGTVDMTGELKTDVGTFGSDVANGASAVAFRFGNTAAYSTSGAKLLVLDNAGTDVLGVSYQGGISHLNSGATTAAHAQSLNLNWGASSSRTSSGQYSAVIGRDNRAQGAYAIALGRGNFADTSTSIALGQEAKANITNELVFASSRFSTDGDAQTSLAVAKAATTDATQTTLTVNGENHVIPADSSWAFSVLVVARSDESDGNDSAAYRLEGLLARDEASSTALVGSVTKTVIAESAGATAWDVTAEADDTNEALAIKVTGEAATNIRWVAKVDIAQVTYA